MFIPFEPASFPDCAALLTSRGIALTRQRLDIARVLFARCQHLSADQILADVNAGGADISKATVYGTPRGHIRNGVTPPNKDKSLCKYFMVSSTTTL